MNGQVIALDLAAKRGFKGFPKRGKANVADPSAGVAKQMIVRLLNDLKAVGGAVDMGASHNAGFVHGVQIVIDGRHGNAGHFQLGKKENLVGG